MTTDVPQPTNEDLEHKLDEIKTALNIRTTTTSVLSDTMERLVKIENGLVAIENSQRIRSQRLYWFDAGLVLMVAGTTVVLTSLQAPYWWGIIIFVVGLLLHRFGSRLVK